MERPGFQPLEMPTRQLDTPVVVGPRVRWFDRLALAWLILTAAWLRTIGSGKVAAASAQAERSRCRSQVAL